MSKSSSMNRVLTIIKYLNNGKVLNLTNLSYEFDVSERTIRRDIELIQNVFDEGYLKKDGENYFTVQKNILSKVLKGTELATLTHILNMFEISGSKLKLDDNLKKLIKESGDIYQFNSKPFEYLKNYEIVENIEKAIKFRQIIKIKYQTPKGEKTYEYKPYKILLLNENFYLLGTDLEGYVRFSRIGLIRLVEIKSQTFYHNQEIMKFIKNIQTPWAKLNNKEIEITIKTKPFVSKYFKMKDFYKSQKLLKENEDGSCLISYSMTCFQEIDEFLIKWLPNIEIISPVELKNHLKILINNKLNSL